MSTAKKVLTVQKDRWRVGRHRRLLVAKEIVDGRDTGRFFFWFKCPACAPSMHAFAWPQWDFDGNFEAPTFSPRLVASPSCVCWVQSGMVTFSSQSKHLSVGKVLPLPLLDDEGGMMLSGSKSALRRLP